LSQRRIKHMFKQLRDASLKYKLIEDGDRILAGISGGKDSLTMLYLLTLVQKYTPVSFTLYPVMLDMGWGEDHQAIADYCESLGLELRVENTHIGRIVFEHRREKNPCSLCSNLRHGALNRIAKSLGCNKVALGHHMDDAVHTFFLSMLFEGRFHVFKPRTYLDRSDITLIRPMVYISEEDIAKCAASLKLPVRVSACPASGQTKRDEVKQLLDLIEQQFPGARQRFLASLENAAPDTFWSSTPDNN
jgi:tRNA 2-thiocytidine biosynthesis protein TtcA